MQQFVVVVNSKLALTEQTYNHNPSSHVIKPSFPPNPRFSVSLCIAGIACGLKEIWLLFLTNQVEDFLASYMMWHLYFSQEHQLAWLNQLGFNQESNRAAGSIHLTGTSFLLYSFCHSVIIIVSESECPFLLLTTQSIFSYFDYR